MPDRFLGKVLFPRQQPWQQRRQAKAIIWSLLVALVFAGIVAGIMFAQNSRR
jgi:hypothetical protein